MPCPKLKILRFFSLKLYKTNNPKREYEPKNTKFYK